MTGSGPPPLGQSAGPHLRKSSGSATALHILNSYALCVLLIQKLLENMTFFFDKINFPVLNIFHRLIKITTYQ